MGSTAALPFSYNGAGRHWSLQSPLSFKGNQNPYEITNQQDILMAGDIFGLIHLMLVEIEG